jgi:hypothetical protein
MDADRAFINAECDDNGLWHGPEVDSLTLNTTHQRSISVHERLFNAIPFFCPILFLSHGFLPSPQMLCESHHLPDTGDLR